MNTRRGGGVRAVGSVNSVPLLLALLLLVAGCGGGGQQQEEAAKEEQQGSPVAGEFVGVVPEINAFLALVASSPQQAGTSPQLRAYLCDGESMNVWLTGKEEPANTLDLSSDDGANLKGELSPNEATGTLTLADGRALAFSIPKATGIEGLYDMTLSSDGQMSGTSEVGGNTLEGRLGDRQQDGRYLLSGTITSAEGDSQEDFQALATPDASGEIRGILISDGTDPGIGHGGNGFKGGGKKGSGTGFIQPGGDL